jgi:hypothetical protein
MRSCVKNILHQGSFVTRATWGAPAQVSMLTELTRDVKLQDEVFEKARALFGACTALKS